MKIRFLEHDVASWIKPREIPPRTVGRHVSEVIVKMLKALPGKKYDRYGQNADDTRKPAYEVGYLWEDVLREHLQKRVEIPAGLTLIPPEEISRAGVYGTPDRILWDDPALRFTVDETKATYMSAKGLEVRPEALLEHPKFTYWLLQSKTYAAMLRRYTVVLENNLDEGLSRPILIALPDDPLLESVRNTARCDPPPLVNIRALFLNGDYRGTLALPFCWEIEYTVDELEHWWASVVEFVRENPEGDSYNDADRQHDPAF